MSDQDDHDAQDIRLDDDALEQAAIAAGAAVHAGLEEHEQLVHGIKAYLWEWAAREPDLRAILSYER